MKPFNLAESVLRKPVIQGYKGKIEDLSNLSMDELIELRKNYVFKTAYITITEELNNRVKKDLGDGYDIDWLLNQEAGMPS